MPPPLEVVQSPDGRLSVNLVTKVSLGELPPIDGLEADLIKDAITNPQNEAELLAGYAAGGTGRFFNVARRKAGEVLSQLQ